MKKMFKTVAALALVMFAGCTTDMTNDVVTPIDGKTTVTVGIDDTRTHLGELVEGVRKVYWSNGDQIAVNGVVSQALALEANDVAAAAFAFEGVLEYPYSVLYPAEMYKDAQTITLPALQESATDSFGADSAPMATYAAADEPAVLHHLAGVVRLQVTLPAESTHGHHRLNKVEVRGNAGEQVSGDFAINYQTATLTALSTAEADKVVAARSKKTLAAGETDDVFVVVPAQDYTQGITVRLIDDAGHYMDIASKPMTIEKGEIKAMPVVEFVPTGTLIGIEIKSAADLVAFAKAYNAGEYAEVQPLNIVFANDIVFDDETNAAWTPIGVAAVAEGEEDNYFDGCIDGQGYSIKSWNTSRPLVAYTSADGVIENLTIDASCTLVANNKDEIPYFGAFVGYHRGILTNCHINANVTVTGNTWTTETTAGALVGRLVVGSVVNCSVGGDFEVDGGFKTAEDKAYFGGAVGRVSNTAGVISGVKVYGNVSHKGGSSYVNSNKNDGTVYFGGIVGLLAGTCTDSHLDNATANTKQVFFGNFLNANFGTAEDYNGNDFRTMYVGGIAGYIEENGEVANCTNDSKMVLCQYNGEANGSYTDVSRYLNVGGIVGQVAGKLSGCTMYGDFANRSSCLQQTMGGIAGVASATATISNCANEGAEMQANTASKGYNGARNGRYGGVIALNHTVNVSKLTNKMNLTASRPNTNDTSVVLAGGIFGHTDAEGTIDGNNEIVNYGKVLSTHGVNIKYTALGGVAGASNTSLKNVKNAGLVQFTSGGLAYKNVYLGGVVALAGADITLDSITNEGIVYYYDNQDTGYASYNVCVGGILGSDGSDAAAGVAVAAATVQNSTNSGTVAAYTKKRANGRSLALGGIVGVLTNTASKVSMCTNTGVMGNKTDNNNRVGSGDAARVIRTAGGCSFVGGIAGFVEGADGALISIENCTYNQTASDAYSYKADYANSSNRGEAGGLVSFAKYANIKNSNCTATLWTQNTTDHGGLVCQLINSNLEGCTLSNSTLGNGGGGAVGGFVGCTIASTVKNNTLANCTLGFNTGTVSKGVLSGISDDASSFTDNKVSGTFIGEAITLSSVMVGAGGGTDNLTCGNPTVTGTTLYTE